MRPLIIGEVLFDVFPDGKKVLGGAPFNVAWNLKGMGLEPIFTSRIGKDPFGKEILDKMKSWGMDTTGIQLDEKFPTGSVAIHVEEKAHSFEILPCQAYDYIEKGPVLDLIGLQKPSLIYHGSLAARRPESLRMLKAIQSLPSIPIFIDINLRSPWWERDTIQELMQAGTWIKLNEPELAELGITQKERSNFQNETQRFLKENGWQLLIVTMGAQGAFLVSEKEIFTEPVRPALAIKDTIGAGDAFSSVIIYGLLNNWSIKKSLQKATEFASLVCTIQVATIFDRSFYEL